jgi:hypothetical protein
MSTRGDFLPGRFTLRSERLAGQLFTHPLASEFTIVHWVCEYLSWSKDCMDDEPLRGATQIEEGITGDQSQLVLFVRSQNGDFTWANNFDRTDEVLIGVGRSIENDFVARFYVT